MARVNRKKKWTEKKKKKKKKLGKKNNRNAEEWKGFSSLATSTYYHRWRHPKINVTILSKIGRSIRVSTNRETTYPDARELAISEIIPVHNASVLLRILKKKKKRGRKIENGKGDTWLVLEVGSVSSFGEDDTLG